MDEPSSAARGEYKTHEPVTEVHLQQIDAALEKTKGHRSYAAQMLGIDKERLDNVVYNNPALRAKWSKSKPDIPAGEAAEIDRPVPAALVSFSKEEKKLAEAIERQDAKLQRSWSKMGRTTEQRKFLSQLQAAYATNLQGVADLVVGGVSETFVNLVFMEQDLLKKIQDIDDNPEQFVRMAPGQFGERVVKSAHEFRCELVDRLLAVQAEKRKTMEAIHRAQYIRMQMGKGGEEKDAPKRKKAGWTEQGRVMDAETVP